MTTNCGAENMSKGTMGFARQDHTTDIMASINRAFAPEFRNRLDNVVLFKPLSQKTIHHVVDKFIMELEVQLEKKGVHLEIELSAKDWLAEHGYDEKMGARPMERLIQEKIKQPLAEELLFGQLAYGGTVTITAENGELKFGVEESLSV
jgi:ATP-dependent Clp protease ATP-binding subunit ClpA